MKKLIIIFLSIFIAIPNGYADNVANCNPNPTSQGYCEMGCGFYGISGQCEPCRPGTYNPGLSQTCEPCMSRPANATFLTDNDPVIGDYTDVAYGNTFDDCPWQLTCGAGQYWNDDEAQCTKCGEYYQDNNGSCTVIGRGNNTLLDSSSCDFDNRCIGNIYKLKLKKNRGLVSNDIDLYYKYSTGFAQSENPETWSSKLPEVHDSSRRNTLRGYYNNKDCSQGSLVFRSNGSLVENGWSLLGGDKTLYACWDKLTQTINYYYENNISIPGSSHTCTADDDDNFECIAKAYQPTSNGVIFKNYKCEYTTPNSGNNRTPCGTVNIGGDIPELGNATIYLTIQTDPCPAGYYCEAGTQTSCPGGSTSDAGATDINKCYMDKGTQFCDSVGCFNLPDGTKIYYHGGD